MIAPTVTCEAIPGHADFRRLDSIAGIAVDLRDAMLHNGWHGINTEWWHFDCGDRHHGRKHYTRVL